MIRDELDEDAARRLDAEGLSLRRALRPRGPVHLAVTRRLMGGATVVEVGGELDVLTTGKLGPELDQIVRKERGDVIVDLRSTGFVDSAGLQLLLGARRRLSRQDRAMAVVCGPGPVRRVIERARLELALGVVTTFDEPRQSHAGQGAS